MPADSTDKDWRLEADLESSQDPHGVLQGLVEHFRGPDVVGQIEQAAPHDAVITHDGRQLFAYTADEPALLATRSAIESALSERAIKAQVRISHWDDGLDEWRQTDPPATAEEKQMQDAADQQAETVQTRTLVASAGKLIRRDFEQSMRDWAAQLGIECELVDHPHLLTTQVCFTVKGPKRKLDEFSKGLTAEEQVIIRTERQLMLNPL